MLELKDRTTTAVEDVIKEETKTITTSDWLDEIAFIIPEEREGLSEKIKNFFSTLMELKGIYFGGSMRLDYLDKEYRANLSVQEKSLIDADLHSVWTSPV